MRIISGTHKGKVLNAPKNLPARPTTDRAKEGLFNILQHQYEFEGLAVLDLFAGIGSFSFECLSRGVGTVTAVDRHVGCTQFLEKTGQMLGEATKMQIIQKDVFKFLSEPRAKYHFIFADPPYALNQNELYKIVNLIFENTCLDKAIGLLMVEHADKIYLKNHPKYLYSRTYGTSVFSFFEW